MRSTFSYSNNDNNDHSSPLYATAVPVEHEQPKTATRGNKGHDVDAQKLAPKASEGVTQHMVNCLVEQGFTTGLAHSLSKNKKAFPLRIWVIDNSGSMNKTDGHRIVASMNRSDIKFVSSTRWEEIRETTRYHVELAGLLEAPTRFRLLNNPGSFVGPQQFSIAETSGSASHDVHAGNQIMAKATPRGCTPLTDHILEIHRTVSEIADQLRRTGQRTVVVIATDGLPTDEYGVGGSYQSDQFVRSLRMLEGLPIWLVIRLCTDEDDVVDFYNNLDEQLELSLDVLDDFCAEALEVYEHNKWLNYGLCLHRLREMGYYDRTFDLIDERALTKTELRDFMGLIFGQENMDGVPDPSIDWLGFTMDVERLLKNEQLQWNPVKKNMTPWIDMKMLHRQYGPSSGCAPGCTIM